MEFKLNAWQWAIANNQDLYDWQVETLEAVSRGYPTALRTCNGAGKTSVVAGWAVSWFFQKYPQGWLIATSSSFNQLKNQTWPAIQTKLHGNYTVARGSSPLSVRTPYHNSVEDPVGGEGIGFATNDPGRAEGWHPKIDKETDPVFILIDEGKTVPDEIWTAFDRCTYSFFLVISSVGPPMGSFFECFHSQSKYYHKVKASYRDCPHMDLSKVNKWRDTYGEDSYEFRSMAEAEFTDSGEDYIMTKMQLEQSLQFQPEPDEDGEWVGFFDFARGGDENTFTVRKGNTIKLVEAWRDRNTVRAVNKFIRLAKEEGLHAEDCWGDADGLGGPMVDMFHDRDFPINEFHGGQAALDDNFLNLISEAWIQGCRRIARGDFHFYNMDTTTKNQITNRKFEWNEKGKKKAESKKDLAKRGVKSPDRGDGVFGVAVCGSHMSGAFTRGSAEESSSEESDFTTSGISF